LQKNLDKIWDKLNESKISLLEILALVSLVLIPMFWDKIVEFFKAIDKKLDISGIIDRFIASINWEKHIGTVIGFVLDEVKKKFNEFI